MAGNYYRITLTLNQSIQGWSETYISQGGLSETELKANLDELITKRNAFCYDNCGWVGVRVANLGANPNLQPLKRQSRFLRPGLRELFPGVNITIPSVGANPTGVAADAVTQSSFLNMAATTQLTLANGSVTNRYLAGIRRAAFRSEPIGLDLLQLGADIVPINAYLAALKAKWAVWGRVPDPTEPKVSIQKYVNQTDTGGNLGVVLDSATSPVFKVGDLLQITGARAKRFTGVSVAGAGSVNGKWHVDSVVLNSPTTGSTTVFLTGTGGLLASAIKIYGQAQKVKYQVVAIQNATLNGAATHKRGRPIGARRGRRLIRVSLDP